MTITAVGVVVPAHDEEQLLPACLDALEIAAAAVDVAVRVVVVLDSCTDRTASVVESRSWVTSVVTEVRNVGLARAAGADEALRLLRPYRPTTSWLATTDADTVVPPDWLARQLGFAAAGWEVVVGTVRVVDWRAHPPEVAPRWHASYSPVEHHPHVHGANLGCTAAAYRDAGGWPPLARDEDVALLAALRHRRVIRTATLPVVTSARRDPRAAGGFGDALRDLAGGAVVS